ncbi:MAG: M1 family metallopeptidase [Chitinophagales bacterium]
MKQLLLISFLIIAFSVRSQSNYWQQNVKYKIDVSLNDTLHSLDGFITIQYTNHSPDTLRYILFHLWPNAFRDASTPFAKQLLENGQTDFHFSKSYQRGFIDHLDFKANAEVCLWDYDSASLEIAKIWLNKPLASGQSVLLSTPFRVKIPQTFSRLGHVGQSYQITQWYPKPAVYDKKGWHAMPYLDQGEFYSEFGSYDVSITLPGNYIVGATGDLQTEEEIKWMDSLAQVGATISYENDTRQKFPPSSSTLKTIRFTQNNVHDFAWFADKRYHVLKGDVELPSTKRKVTTWSLFTDNQATLWSKSPEYIHDAVFYYSRWVGEYPYRQVTVVDGAIHAGGGMEYPNVTVIGEVSGAFSLDDVIAHEVGHNWFYGMLGSNEREHAWMDEGINSFYEERYIHTKYPNQKMIGRFPQGVAKAFDMAHYKHKYLMDAGYQVMARENYDEPLEQSSQKFTDFNYEAGVYGKSMLIFEYLEAYLGTARLDSIMKKYFAEWHYKHPQPEDIRNLFETETGKNLTWFFDDLLKTKKKIDYSLVNSTIPKVRKLRKTCPVTVPPTITVKNAGEVNSPLNITFLKGDSIITSQFFDGFSGKKTFTIREDYLASSSARNFSTDTTLIIPENKIEAYEQADKIQIDPLLQIPEINRRNNTYFINKKAHFFEKLRFQFLGSLENQNRTQVFFAPYVAWNNYDKTQVGLALYSPFLPARKFNYLVVPAIGTGSKQFIGLAKFSYNFYPDKLQRFTVGVNGRRFSYILFPQPLLFHKLEPYINFEFKKKTSRSPYTHTVNMRSVIMWLDWINFEKNKTTQRYFVNEIKYQMQKKSTLNPFSAEVKLQQGNSFVNISAQANFLISYKRKNEGFSIRVFAGGFLLNTKSTSDVSSPNPKFYLSNGTTDNFAYWLQKDYMFDENFIDRNGRDKYLGRQVAKTNGAFRSLTNFGATNKFLMSVNLTSTTHRFFPIQPFVNAAFILNDLKQPQFAAEFGLSAVLLKDMIEIHLPLVTTKNISNNQKAMGLTKLYQKFTFTLKLQLQKPLDIIRRFI